MNAAHEFTAGLCASSSHHLISMIPDVTCNGCRVAHRAGAARSWCNIARELLSPFLSKEAATAEVVHRFKFEAALDRRVQDISPEMVQPVR